jgi:hypothetical protein
VLAVTAAEAARPQAPRRTVILPGVTAVGFLTVSGASGVGYVLPLLVVAGLIGWIARRPRSGAIATASVASAAVTGVLLLAGGVVPSRLALVPTIPDIGNLYQALSPWQAVGVWIGADFRVGPEVPVATALLIAVTAVLAVVGIVGTVRERSWALALFTGTALLVMAYSQFSGGAWLAGKAIAVASPGVIAAALAGAAWLARRWRAGRWVSLGAAAAVVLGVAWSNALAFRTVWLAPVPSQAELAAIGRDFAGQGPALMTDMSVFGGRHFLRAMDTEVASELRVNPIPLRDGSTGQKGESFDVVAFPPSTLADYPILVLRRSPSGTRPPADYSLVRPGRFYDVWKRQDDAGQVAADVPLSGPFALAPDAACRAITDLATANPNGTLAAGVRRAAVSVPLDATSLPAGWSAGEPGSGAVIPSGPGQLATTFDVPAEGDYEVWLGGSFPGQVTVTVDGTAELEAAGVIEGDAMAATSLGALRLSAGTHDLVLTYATPWWRPGVAAGPFPMGPVSLTPLPRTDAVLSVPVADAATLCGADVDWVAADN